MNQALPESFRRTIQEVHGKDGQRWLEDLPDALRRLEQSRGLQVLEHFPLSYNFVAPAVGPEGEDWVLKLGVPNPELSGEIMALKTFAGGGAVRMLYGDPQTGVLLLERVIPGTPLSQIQDDEQATRIAAGVMRQLWQPVLPQAGFRTVAYLGGGFQRLRLTFEGGSGPFAEHLVAVAEAVLAEATTSPAPARLLHGDLHHDNILFDERRGWLAIDPAGIAGDPGYEAGALLFNPLPNFPHRAGMPHLLRRRLEILAEELQLPLAVLVRWGIFKCVLDAWWSYEDHGRGWEPVLSVAEALARI